MTFEREVCNRVTSLGSGVFSFSYAEPSIAQLEGLHRRSRFSSTELFDYHAVTWPISRGKVAVLAVLFLVEVADSSPAVRRNLFSVFSKMQNGR